MIWNLAAYQASTGVLHVQVCGTGDNIEPPPLHMVCCLAATAVRGLLQHRAFTFRFDQPGDGGTWGRGYYVILYQSSQSQEALFLARRDAVSICEFIDVKF